MKHLILFISMLLVAANCYSYDFEVDGLYYNITGNKANPTCEVTKNIIPNSNYSDYTGSITIPEFVTYQGMTFNVTSIGEMAFYYSKITDISIPKSITKIERSAFKDCTKLIHFYNMENLIELGDYAFYGCGSLVSISIPNVNTIPDYCFQHCSSLKEIVLDNTVNIKTGAFNYCTKLSKITAPKLISIEDQNITIDYTTHEGGYYNGAFYNCAITELYLPNLERMGENSFGYCKNLERVDLPKLKTFYVFSNYYNRNGSSCGAFIDCENLKSVNLPLVEDLWNGTFKNCTSLETIELPNLKYIWKQTSDYSGAFQGCTNLKKIELNENIKNIPSKTFANCVNLKEIYVYNPIPPIVETNAFTNISVLECNVYVPYKKGELYASTDGWSSFWNIIEMESNIKAESVSIVTSINNVVTDVSGSSIIKCIGCDPFTLSANVLPEDTRNKDVQWSSSVPSVATIDADGIVNIIGIGETIITASTTDGSDKSASCKLIVEKAINLKDTDIELAKGDVCKLTAMTSEGLWDKTIIWTSSNENVAKVSSTGEVVAVGEGNTIITATAANNETATCSVKVISYECGDNLTWAISEDGTLTISGSGDMDNYSSSNAPWADYRKKINNIVIGDEVTSIGDYAFEDCTNVTSVKIGSSVTKIGDSAFHYCENLSEIIIPNSVVSIGEEAFYHCESATSLQLGNSLSKVGDSAFEGCYKIKSVEIPKSLTAISYGMFSNCESLKDIKFPNTLTSIGSYAFEYCESLESLHLPSSLNYIGYEAFYNCKNLFDVHCAAEKINDTNKDAFESTPIEQCVLYVPEKSVLYYSLREPWKYFGAILAEDESNDIQRVITLDEYNEIYTINGAKLSKPRKGMNIIKTSNGLIRKVNIK